MSKILYIANIRIPTDRAHGVQIMKMCEAFSDSGSEVELMVPAKRNNLGISDVFGYYGIKNSFRITRVPASDLLGLTRRFGRVFVWIDLFSFLLSLLFKKTNDAFVYTRDYWLMLPFTFRNNRVVVEIHDIPKSEWLFLKLIRRADRVIVITSHLKRILSEKGIDEVKIMVAPDAIDPKDFETTINQAEARSRLGLTNDKKIVMYAGLLDEWKGYRTLLEVSNLLPSQFQVVIIGGTQDQIAQLRSEYTRAIFLGYKPYKELVGCQMAADILVIPNSGKTMISRYYTSPLKLFAYMASEVPIVASDLPSIRDILDESTAFFFNPDDSKNLADTVVRTIENYDEALRKSAKAQVASREYSWTKRAEKILKFVE